MKNSENIKALRAAFPHTLPIMAGFLFLGVSYGIMMNAKGFSFVYPMMMSIFIFAGSMEFLMANILLGAFNPLEAVILTLMINARHLFYGVSMLEKYKGTGLKKLYLIYGMCDESFSVNCSAEPPPDVDRGKFMLFVTLLNHLYWITGATLGGIFGAFITFNTNGIDFVMTAMFTVILLEQILGGKKNIPSVLIGVLTSVLCLLVFKQSNFIIPSMIAIAVMLLVFKKPITSLQGEEGGSEK